MSTFILSINNQVSSEGKFFPVQVRISGPSISVNTLLPATGTLSLPITAQRISFLSFSIQLEATTSLVYFTVDRDIVVTLAYVGGDIISLNAVPPVNISPFPNLGGLFDKATATIIIIKNKCKCSSKKYVC